MTANEAKKYNSLEPVLNFINKNFISLKDEEIKRNNMILQEILDQIVKKMKEQDPLFQRLYQRVFYGGSFYDGLRVGEPAEFDLDLLLKLPVYAEPTITTSNIPGFVHLQMTNFDGFMKQPEAQAYYQNFHKLFDDKKYLHTEKLLRWMEGILQRALNTFQELDPKTRLIQCRSERFHVKFTKGGPALTLHVENPTRKFKMDIDLVTCFIFGKEKWPTNGFKPNPVAKKPDFFIVPKKPKCDRNEKLERYWRLSFQEQERELIDGKRSLKPTIKLLKKMRDTMDHKKIASYYIKTAVLLIADKKDDDFWAKPQSFVFMTILEEYQKMFENKRIPYYWNSNNNLIGNINEETLMQIGQRLKIIIKKIENNLNEPKTIAQYLLNREELVKFNATYQ